ncbi:MAG: flagellar basal body-associated FliL family protein [Planctomycetaceae bacterium]
MSGTPAQSGTFTRREASMRRLSLVASGLGLSVAVSVLATNLPVQPGSNQASAAELPDAVASPPAANPSPEKVTPLRDEYDKLKKENESLAASLAEARARLASVWADAELREALVRLSHVAAAFPDTEAARTAARILELVHSEEDSTVGVGDPNGPAFIEFGELVTNLSSGRVSRYAKVSIYLQVPAAKRARISKAVSANKIILRNWLLSHLSGKTVEALQGSMGQDTIRLEIKNRFNELLFPNAMGEIDDVLFKEFAVQ